MLHAGLDLSRKRLDVCLLSDHNESGLSLPVAWLESLSARWPI